MCDDLLCESLDCPDYLFWLECRCTPEEECERHWWERTYREEGQTVAVIVYPPSAQGDRGA